MTKRLILIPVVDAMGQRRTLDIDDLMYQVYQTGHWRQGGERGHLDKLTAFYKVFVDEVSVVKSPQSPYNFDFLTKYGHVTDRSKLINSVKLSKGDKVVVYQDPMTQWRSEGVATLVKLIDRSDFPVNWGKEVIERWMVKFEGETQKVERRLLAPWI